MKKILMLLPCLMLTSMPLTMLTSCHNTTIIQFSAIKDDTFNGITNLSGKSKAFSVVFSDGTQIIDVTKETTIDFSDYADHLTWNSNDGTIAWDNSFSQGNYPLTITATYKNLTVSTQITLSFNQYEGQLYFANDTTEQDTYWNRAGQSDEILLFYFDGQKLVNVTSKAQFTISQHSDIFKIENNHLTWPNNVIPGTYQFAITATYQEAQATSDLLTIHAHGMHADDFHWEIINDTEANICYYNGDGDHPDVMYLPESGTKDGKTYEFTCLSQETAQAQRSFPGTRVVYLNQNLKTIDNEGIYDYEGVLEEIYLPAGIETVGHWSFRNLSSIQSIHYPNKLIDWIMNVNKDEEMFKFCETGYQLMFDDDSYILQKNDPRIEFNKNSIEDFDIEITDDTFAIQGLQESAMSLERIVIPVTIDTKAGQNPTCHLKELKTNGIVSGSLKTLCIPPQLEKICAHAIGCNNLNAIYYLGTLKQWSNIEKESQWIDKPATIICLDGTLSAQI